MESKEMWKKSFISNKYPTYRDIGFKSVESWLAGKRVDDGAEGLWRVHDCLYDLTDFIDKHPGGPDWLRCTKGTDITEAFEAHHISLKPFKLLEKFKIRDAKNPRNITLTFEDGGFYKTLRDRVRIKLESVDYSPTKRSDFIHTALLLSTYFTAVESAILQSKFVAVLAAILLTWTVISAHNYFHRRDNWRMYTFNLSLMNYRNWRISHAMSHHLYPNSFHDLELSMFEPHFCWIPNPEIKNLFQRYGSWFYGPIIYTALYGMELIKRIVYSVYKQKNIIHLDDLIALSVPAAMYIFSNAGLFVVLKIWLIIISAGSFVFGVIGLNAAHHHPDVVHDGDKLRDNRDWGIFQLDAVMDRNDIKGHQFWVLTHFGDHALHHLFPTLDHGILPQLYPVLYKTIEDFEGELRACSWIHHIIGQHEQLARIRPTIVPPGKNKVN